MRPTSRPRALAPLALFAASIAVALAPAARAQQQPPTAATVAAWVQRFYDQTQTMSARFVQRYVNRVYSRTDVSRGRVRFKKPGRMRFDYEQPNGKVVVSDGDRLLVYEPPDDGRGAGQYYEQTVADAQLPGALGFLTGTGRIERDFTFRLLEARSLDFRSGQVLELRPRRPSPHYSRILLFVDGSEQRRGVVHRVLIVDATNNQNRFDFQEQQLNREMGDDVFRWRPPRGARRIQP